MMIRSIVLGVFVAFVTTSVSADLVVSVQGPNGENELSIAPGDPLDLFVVTGGRPSIYFGSFALDVLVSNGGLPVVDYALGSDFDGGFDISNVTDSSALRFEAATAIGRIAEPGQIVSISFNTSGTALDEQYVFDVHVDFIGFCDLICTSVPENGTPFTLAIVPEPMSMMLLGVGGLIAMRRRVGESQ